MSENHGSVPMHLNPIALRTAKTLESFGCSECSRVKKTEEPWNSGGASVWFELAYGFSKHLWARKMLTILWILCRLLYRVLAVLSAVGLKKTEEPWNSGGASVWFELAYGLSKHLWAGKMLTILCIYAGYFELSFFIRPFEKRSYYVIPPGVRPSVGLSVCPSVNFFVSV